jgi:hypothetical protein
MTTQDKIIAFIKEKGQTRAVDMVDYLGISKQALFKHLSKLVSSEVIIKIGRPPKVFYSLNKKIGLTSQTVLPEEIKKIIEQEFLIITPAGEKKMGVDGFVYWCDKNNLSIQKTADEYIKTLEKYDTHRQDGFIDGREKMKNTFSQVYLDQVFYLDFYSIERFGKTKLGQLLLYAKQSQNIILMNEIITIIKPKIEQLIKKFHIDAIAFVPPTVKRERQLMKVLSKGLTNNLRKISLTKISTPVAIPQKTLNKLEDRIENARSTFVVEDDDLFENILLVDDAIGSGATLNEVAKKIKDKKICKGKIIGVSITGSFKEFDVISGV